MDEFKIDYFKEYGDIIGDMFFLFYCEMCGLNNYYLFDFILEEWDNREINLKKINWYLCIKSNYD